METEIEAKFLDVDHGAIRAKLRALGADLRHPERLMRRRMFDFPDLRLDKKDGAWIRVRDEGDRVTLSLKKWHDHSIRGTKEVMVVVSDFEGISRILEAIGLTAKSYQETKREEWRIGEVEVSLDTWPWIPPVVEVEAQTEKEVQNIAAKLGLDWSGAFFGGITRPYQHYYDVTREEIDYCPRIVFKPAPVWLEAKRRK